LQEDSGGEDDRSTFNSEREAKVMFLLPHKNIVRVHGFLRTKYKDNEGLWNMIVMEYLDPEIFPTLSSIILKKEAQDPILISRLVRSVSNAVEFAACVNVFNRDIKPGNIYVGQTEVKISDYGASNIVIPESTFLVGTPFYMSPEAGKRGVTIDERSEEFSLSSVVFEMITSEPMFGGDSIIGIVKSVVNDPCKSILEFVPENSAYITQWEKLDLVIKKAQSKDPNQRYQKIGEFAGAVENALLT